MPRTAIRRPWCETVSFICTNTRSWCGGGAERNHVHPGMKAISSKSAGPDNQVIAHFERIELIEINAVFRGLLRHSSDGQSGQCAERQCAQNKSSLDRWAWHRLAINWVDSVIDVGSTALQDIERTIDHRAAEVRQVREHRNRTNDRRIVCVHHAQ